MNVAENPLYSPEPVDSRKLPVATVEDEMSVQHGADVYDNLAAEEAIDSADPELLAEDEPAEEKPEHVTDDPYDLEDLEELIEGIDPDDVDVDLDDATDEGEES